MTVKEKQGFGLYFLFAFGMAWLCQVGGCIALLQQNNAVLYQLALIVTMFCPLLAVLLVQKAFLRQPTGIGWKVQGKRRFWLAAWFGPAVLTLLGAVLYFAVFPSRLDFSGSWLVAAYGGEMDAQTLRSQLGVSTLGYLLQNGLFAVLLAPAINMFPALGEEVGWRGYMMPRLKERFGLLNGRLLGGCVGRLALAAVAAGGLRVWHQLSGRTPAGAGGMVRGLLCPQHSAGLALRKDRLHLGAGHRTRCAECGRIHAGGAHRPGGSFLLYGVGPDAHWSDWHAAGAGRGRLADPAADEAGRKELNQRGCCASFCTAAPLLLYK